MAHISENSKRLRINQTIIEDESNLTKLIDQYNDVCLVILPSHSTENRGSSLDNLEAVILQIVDRIGENATLITLGETVDLVQVQASVEALNYQLWISIKRENPKFSPDSKWIPENHYGALIHTKYAGSLKHTITRIEYTYCPACDRTTKDYGGKKHTYNSYGTLISDVWRDISGNLEGDVTPIIERFADLFGIDEYSELRFLDCRNLWNEKAHYIAEVISTPYTVQPALEIGSPRYPESENGQLIMGDCREELKKLPDNSIDFAFTDPPYNLGKNYNNYSDDLSIKEYFAWCDEWITELGRLLKPGRTVAILNIPIWAIRHFLHMETILHFQNWIVWDALSYPVRKIMPANYTIVCFSKGEARPLPGLASNAGPFKLSYASKTFMPLEPLAEGYCLRASCVRKRNAFGFTDRGQLTDVWWDIHRLKHNSRRVDHPCQLPPQLLYRLISIFTKPDEMILDCFDGAGTTTLTARQLNRQFIGIELSEKYYEIAKSRHDDTRKGIDPFRKEKRTLTEKNSPVARMPKQTYEVPKKTLQLEVRRVSKELNRLPTRTEMIEHGKYPIKYYDEYFSSWGEVCAAARHDGMSETRANKRKPESSKSVNQLQLFDRGSFDSKR